MTYGRWASSGHTWSEVRRLSNESPHRSETGGAMFVLTRSAASEIEVQDEGKQVFIHGIVFACATECVFRMDCDIHS